MDPQENTTPAVPDRPLTRRELRERERAQQESQQRMLTPQRRAVTVPPSAFDRQAADRTENAPSGGAGTDGARSEAPSWPAAPSQVRPPVRSAAADALSQPAPKAPSGETTGQHGIHGRRSARSFAAKDTPETPVAGSPTSAAMGWGSYPPSAGSDSPAFLAASPAARASTAAPSILPAPVPAVRSEPDTVLPETREPFAPEPAPPADPAKADTPTAAPAASEAPEADTHSAALTAPAATAYFPAVQAAQHATRAVPQVSPSDEAPVVRNVFPVAAQAFSRDSALAVAEPEHVDDPQWDDHGALAEGYDTHYEDFHPHPAEDLHPFDDSHGVFGDPVVTKAPSRKKRRFKVVIGLALALGLFIGAAFLGVQFLKPILGLDKVKDFPGPGTGSVVVTVQPGSGPAAVAASLQQADVIADSATFLKAFAAAGGSLHPGDFTFKKEMTAADAAAVLTGGSNDKVIYFALSAGMRVGESLDAIAKAASVDRKELDSLNSKPADFGLPAKAKSLEGYLAPGEYRFPVGTSAKDILSKLVTTTLDALKADGVTDANKQYDVLTVASIVQAEGGQADYGNVAGAIYNRLKPNAETNGYIQSDATVTYGLGKKSYHITDAEKADKNNPYNTYANPGLPAGPIGSPGTKAINAAANPTANDYLYWVTVNLDTGETKFSSTYAQHQVYAQQYEQWCQANAGKCQ